MKKVFVVLAVVGAVAIVALIALVIATEPSSASSRSGPDAGPLDVFVHTGLKGLRVTNDTTKAWTRCVAAVTGAYTATVPDLAPRAVVEVYYREFSAGATPLNEDDGYGRALRSTSIVCTGEDDARHDARIR